MRPLRYVSKLRPSWALDKSRQLVIVVAPTVDGKHQNSIVVAYAKKAEGC